VQYNVLLM